MPLRPTSSMLAAALRAAFEMLEPRKILFFGGKGGVGKTTISILAALHLSRLRKITLVTTDPASNLPDIFGTSNAHIRLESIDADRLHQKFLDENLESLLELGDRGTYLDREELARLFRLSLPGVDELMGWLRVFEVADEDPESLVIVDTAPTGHTLRLLSSSVYFERFGIALESMQQKHRELVSQLTRRSVRDAIDEFLERFRADAAKRSALLRDPELTGFIPVTLSEPWVVAQTQRLIDSVRAMEIDVPFAILNHATVDCDCSSCTALLERDSAVSLRGTGIIRAPRSCAPLDSVFALRSYLSGRPPAASTATPDVPTSTTITLPPATRLLFLAGKGGVGKTTMASSIALQLAAAGHPTTLLSIDPAHSVRDVFEGRELPPNLEVETIDTKARWEAMRSEIGGEIERALDSLTPRGFSVAHDGEVLHELLDVGPPGADEIFALVRIHELLDDTTRLIVVDTAPTGHFLRFLALPRTAGEWVRELMRILLHYREIVPAGRLGEELVAASKALQSFETAIRSESTAAIIVTRAESVVMKETERLLDAVEHHGLRVATVIANAVEPASDCGCARERRSFQMAVLAQIERPVVVVERRPAPVVELDDLRALAPLRQTPVQ